MSKILLNKNLNKNKRIKNYESKIGDFQLSKNNHKKVIQYKNDLGNTRMYFSSFPEFIGRICILISQIFFVTAITFNGFVFSKIVADIIPNFANILISQILMRVLFLFSAIFSLVISLFFILPIFLCSRIRIMRTWCIILSTFGSFIIISGLATSIFGYIIIKKDDIILQSQYYIIPIVSFTLALLIMLFGILLIISNSKKKLRKLENAILENYYLNKMRIN